MSLARNRRFTQIGLDRLIRLDWIDRTSSLVLAGNDSAAIKAILKDDLKESFQSGNTEARGSLDKTTTILVKAWVNPPAELESLRVGGLELLTHVPHGDRIAVHWGMLMAVYPFWASVALQVGRLLRLQGLAAAAHIQRRVCEQYGERETVSRRTRYLLRSYLDWGVLSETNTIGIYSANPSLAVDNYRLIAWLVEASLHARSNGSALLNDVLDSPSLFPFRLKPIHSESLRGVSANIDILRQGLDEDLVMLRKQPTKKSSHEHGLA